MATRTTIASKQISKTEYYELTNAILDNLVNSATSPFRTVSDKFEDYLSKIDDADMDTVRKTTAYAEFLKTTYAQVNEKALSAALELLKFNAEIELQRVKAEADIFAVDTSTEKTTAEKDLTTKAIEEKTKNIELISASIEAARINITKGRAELVKQWGVKDTISYSFGSNTYSPIMDPNTNTVYYYRTNSTGSFLKAESAIVAPEIYGVTITTTPLIDGEIFSQTGTMTTTLQYTEKPGIVDQQIKGYDLVNLKDVLKTGDERAALLANAKIAETTGELSFRTALVNGIVNSAETTIGVIADLER